MTRVAARLKRACSWQLVAVLSDYLRCLRSLLRSRPRHEQIGRRLGARYDRALRHHIGAGRWRALPLLLPGLLAIGLATLVYAGLLLSAGAVVWHARIWPLSLRWLLLPPITLCLLWLIFPRFTRVPTGSDLADPETFPVLNATVRAVATALAVPVPRIVLSNRFNAAYGRAGVWRTRLLCLGHPFVALLTPAELIALLAHELAHARDGSLTRGVYVRHALDVLGRLVRARYLRGLTRPLRHLQAILQLMVNLDMQRAELVADMLAARVAGSQHGVTLMHKSTYYALASVERLYRQAIAGGYSDRLSAQVETLPAADTELAWQRAQAAPNAWRAHPDLLSRVALAATHSTPAPQLTLDPALAADLQRELAHWPAMCSRRAPTHGASATLLPAAAD